MDVTEVMHVIGDVEGRVCMLLDDIIDTAGTLVKSADALRRAGASEVYACATHAVLSGEAIDRISKSHLKQVIVTNTVPLTEAGKKETKIKVLSIAGLIARAIQSIHEETSVSSLFV
jgi:ribose-phosphate pyrophosphokinase